MGWRYIRLAHASCGFPRNCEGSLSMAHNDSEGRAMATRSYSTIGPVATHLGIPRWRLAYLIERGDVPGPSLQVAGRRLFSNPDVERIREALARRAASSTAVGDA
jgi:hypothetical protein